MTGQPSPATEPTPGVEGEIVAQLNKADATGEAPGSAAPGPDDMSRVIEEQATKDDGVDSDDVSHGQES